MTPRLAAIAALLASCAVPPAVANPWLAPGDLVVRHDIEFLADAGIIRGPTMTWPISWPDVARDVLNAKLPPDASPALEDSLARVRKAARAAASVGGDGITVRASAAANPVELRTFNDTPRDDGEIEVSAGWMGSRFAANLDVTAVSDPQDGQYVQLDGTYFGFNAGNVLIAASWMERWWGPGWEGSLILGTNARPIPSLRVERNYTDPFETKWLSWLGTWRISAELGQDTDDELEVENTAFFALRFSFRPLPWLELALSRTAQICGDGRPCDWSTFRDMWFGSDNDQDPSDQPGNQMAGYDVRITSPWRSLPVAIYGQAIGEDEAGAMPAKFLGMAGIEGWGSTPWGGLRAHVEYADTTCDFAASEPIFDCAYVNPIYPQGYTHRGRSIGHAMGNDGQMLSLGLLLVRPNGSALNVLLRRNDLNRGGTEPDLSHPIAPYPTESQSIDLQYNHTFAFGELTLGAGYEDFSGDNAEESEFRGSFQWKQTF